MNRIDLSPKQLELLKYWSNDKLKWFNVLDGSVRSGKTIVSIILWTMWIANQPKDGLYLMAGNTLTTLKNNVLIPLTSIVGNKIFDYSIPSKKAMLLGRTIQLEGASDARSASKIRGMTLNGLYLDEISLLNQDFFKTAYERLSKENAILIGTTNPDSPDHWLKKDYIDRADEIDMLYKTFRLDDNIFLPSRYIDNIKKTHTGVFYDRYVLGKWVRAEGVIYKLICDNKDKYMVNKNKINEVKNDFYRINIGVDFGGNKSNTSFVATAYTKTGYFYVLSVDTFKSNNIDPKALEARFINFVTNIYEEYKKTILVFCDSAESILIKGFKRATNNLYFPILVKNAKKRPIIERIRFTNLLLSHNKIKFNKNTCESLIIALLSAVWDDKKIEDKRLDNGTTDIDTLDAFEYSIESEIKFF